jgi:lipopolysaccharide transport system ATP-binding protein
MSSEPVVSVTGLGKRYRIWTQPRPTNLSDRVATSLRLARARSKREQVAPVRQELWALRDVSFEVEAGEILGLIGPNGAGKSTLLSILARITEPTEGRAEIRGRVSSILEVGTGFHPELTGRDNVFLNGAILGMTRAETAAKFDEIVDFSGVRDFIDVPVKRYSSGMYVRLAFAVAAHLDPEVLLLDEVLAVGDRRFQEKCQQRIRELTGEGRTVIFVSHDVNAVARLCNRALVINAGTVSFSGPVAEAIDCYLGSSTLADDPVPIRREGSGEGRIARIRVENGDGGPIIGIGDPITIDVELTAAQPLDGTDLELELGIWSVSGNHYTTLTTAFDPDDPLARRLESGTSVRCRVHELPLKPGSYKVLAALKGPQGLVDNVTDAGSFTISATDFYGTGLPLVDSLEFPVVLAHRWEVAGPGSAAVGSAARREEAE